MKSYDTLKEDNERANDYFEIETFNTVDRPFSTWGNYLIKRK